MFEQFCWEICETSWEKLWLRKDKVLKLSIQTHLSFLEVYSTSFSENATNGLHCSFQMDYNCYPQRPRDSQQQIVTPTSALDISGLTLRQFNDLYPRSSFLGYEQQPYSECPPQQLYIPNSFQQQYVPPQQVEATNGPSYKEVMILMGEVIEKLESMDERLRVDQRCRNIEQEWYENK